MPLPTTYVDGQVIHASSDDAGGGGVNGWTTAINAAAAAAAANANYLNGTTAGATLKNPTVDGYTEGVQNLGTIGATLTIGTLTSGTKAYGTLTTAVASAITIPTIGGGQDLVLYLIQCASGTGGTYSFTAAAGQTLKWAGGTAPTATATNSKTDIVVFTSYDGTNVLGVVNQNF